MGFQAGGPWFPANRVNLQGQTSRGETSTRAAAAPSLSALDQRTAKPFRSPRRAVVKGGRWQTATRVARSSTFHNIGTGGSE